MVLEAVAQEAVGTVEAEVRVAAVGMVAELAAVATEEPAGRADTVELGEPAGRADTVELAEPADVVVWDRDTRLRIRFTATPTLSRGISFLSFRKVPRLISKCYSLWRKARVDLLFTTATIYWAGWSASPKSRTSITLWATRLLIRRTEVATLLN